MKNTFILTLLLFLGCSGEPNQAPAPVPTEITIEALELANAKDLATLDTLYESGQLEEKELEKISARIMERAYKMQEIHDARLKLTNDVNLMIESLLKATEEVERLAHE